MGFPYLPETISLKYTYCNFNINTLYKLYKTMSQLESFHNRVRLSHMTGATLSLHVPIIKF